MSIKILNEGFEKIFSSVKQDKELKEAYDPALKELSSVLLDLSKRIKNGKINCNLKSCADAFQNIIENMYPDKSWWEVTDVNIQNDLFDTQDPEKTALNIIKNIREKSDRKIESLKKSEMAESKQRRTKKPIKESLRRKRLKESEKEPTIKRYSDVRPRSERKYWYFTTHGVQPGSIPKDLHVLEVRDGENERGTQGTFVMLDGVLNTSELRKYDMRELAPKEETEKRRIRPQGERITAWESLKNKKKKSSLKEDYITDLVAEILSGKVKKPSHKVFKWKSNNGDSGEVTYRGVDYAFRKLPNGDYKVMRSSDAGWNWSETLFKESKLKKNKNLKEKECYEKFSRGKKLKESKWSNKWPRYNFEFEDGWKISAVNEEEAVEKYDDIQKNIHKGTSRSSRELDALAQQLYDSNDEWSFNYFSDDELSILWSMCGVLSSKAYDDEVYNAITNRPDEKNIFNKAKDMAVSSVKTNESFYKKQESFKRTKVLKENKKKLTESFDDMEVFMNTWANYNENGADSGITPTGWMSIDDAIEYCEEYADYEPFINDTDNVPFDDINEYSNASSVLQELKELQESDVDEDVVAAIVEAGGYDIKEAVEIAESGDYLWYPGLNSYTDLAYAVIDELGGIGEAVGKNVVNYIDEDQMRREYRWDIREIMRGTAEQEVDDAHEGEDEDSYDREQEIEDWMDEHEDEYLDMIIDEDIRMAEAGEIDLSNYFDYEAYGRDLSFDGFTIVDGGIIRID